LGYSSILVNLDNKGEIPFRIKFNGYREILTMLLEMKLNAIYISVLSLLESQKYNQKLFDGANAPNIPDSYRGLGPAPVSTSLVPIAIGRRAAI